MVGMHAMRAGCAVFHMDSHAPPPRVFMVGTRYLGAARNTMSALSRLRVKRMEITRAVGESVVDK